MSYYIKGNKERGAEVIALLESKGGRNVNHVDGTNEKYLYFITSTNSISTAAAADAKWAIKLICKELFLPEKKMRNPKFKVGNYVRNNQGIPAQIKSVVNVNGIPQYYLDCFTNINAITSSEETLTFWEPKRGETILVKAGLSCEWEEAVYSYSTENSYHTVGGDSWHKTCCIPFDINKLGKIMN